LILSDRVSTGFMVRCLHGWMQISRDVRLPDAREGAALCAGRRWRFKATMTTSLLLQPSAELSAFENCCGTSKTISGLNLYMCVHARADGDQLQSTVIKRPRTAPLGSC
jgi:hypothetical protein